MICPKCSFENPDGCVFCSNCGARVAVWVPDAYSSTAFSDENPFYEEQLLGVTRSYSLEGYTLWLIPASVMLLVSSASMMVGGYITSSRGIMLAGLLFLCSSAAMILIRVFLLREYRATGRPINWGGMGPGDPRAEDVMAMEDDSMDGHAGSDGSGSSTDTGSIFGRR